MEKRIPVTFLAICLLLLSPAASPLFALPASKTTIHIALWALVDAYPGSQEASEVFEGPAAYPAKKIKEIAPFLIEGMVYGWDFVYTPSDTQRNVAEYFSFEPRLPLSQDDATHIQYTKPWEENNRLYCWVDFPLTETMLTLKNQWESVEYQRIRGLGYAPLADGFDGIKKASTEALKDAVREYARGIMKNKPKEISGKVLLVNNPLIAINSGRYKIELDFFIDLSTIVIYNFY
jgi:hypothetical protein